MDSRKSYGNWISVLSGMTVGEYTSLMATSKEPEPGDMLV